ncbi:hypothetical protein PV08_10844 [Exophiala spinifera]|uniref:SnoaL-like domain-containing protein n=1 Tax=Exophiala spinifera TaxID=91928 RepID=A0A0D2AXY8_9EURO|nr:uncharacterized protein PV08_10844 [Exophiala spinifera]KIW11543.1 hypothetical protein PV08_10844 [Exophiala spinifera]
MADTTAATTFADKAETFQAALMSLFSGDPDSTETDLSKLFTPTFTFRADEDKMDFLAFVAHIRRLREILPSVTLTTTQFLRDGAQLAERHSSSTTRPDGSVGKAETFLFAQVAADGRLEWIVETVARKKD